MNGLLLCMALAAAGPTPLTVGDEARTIEVQGRTRRYLVHVPPQLEKSKAWPVVLAFHGAGLTPEWMVSFSGLNEKADREGFAVVYPGAAGPEALALTWNGGNCCGEAMTKNVDDVAFVRALLDELGKAAPIDPKRVFATGMSNGAIFCYRLASELADRIAAIAPVGGPIGTQTCAPSQPVSVLHIHGTHDEFAPLAGGKGPKNVLGTDFFPVEHGIRAWVKANGCPDKATVTSIPDRAGDGMTVTRSLYGPGKEGSEVVLYVVQGGGHTWPGRPGDGTLGKSTTNISANDLLWEFFKKHPRN
jgi:polyhydroxybutyrate depolymerase